MKKALGEPRRWTVGRRGGARWAAIAALALVACGPSSGRPPSAPVVLGPAVEVLTPESARLGLRRSTVADQYFWLRVKVLEGEAPPAFGEAYKAMNDLRAELAPDPTAWEDLEVPLGEVMRVAELVTAYGELGSRKDIGGRLVAFRAPALRLARAMVATEASYRAGPYRDHVATIDRAAKEITTKLFVHEAALLRAIEADLGVTQGIDRPIVLTLVGDAPYPSIFAGDARGTHIASFVRVRGLDGSALFETVLHETIHAVDEITVRSPTALNTLRRVLEQRGLDKSDPAVEMAVNTVTFAEAASLVRRFVDPAHKPLAESGFYTLYPPAPAIVEAWERHLRGEPMETTAEAIASAVGAPDALPSTPTPPTSSRPDERAPREKSAFRGP